MSQRAKKTVQTIKTFHDNGKIATEEPLKDNLPHGICKQWNRNGKLLGKFEMKNGTGTRKIWHENGQLKAEVEQEKGRNHGPSRLWNEKGELVISVMYLNGYFSEEKELGAHAIRQPEGVRSDEPVEMEALVWITNKQSRTVRTVGELNHKQSVLLIRSGYKAGAKKLIAAQLKIDEEMENAGTLDVVLPSDREQRKSVIDWCNAHDQSGWGPHKDTGQISVHIRLD